MATPLSADRIVQALRGEGLKVVEHRSWRTHNRNHKGAWGPVHGVMLHHTVTTGTKRSVDLCYDGYPALPGPLCLGVIAKNGTVYLVGNGRANHAGLGDGDVLRAVIAEKPLPPPDENSTDGNAPFYGFECVNLGDGADPWPEVQLAAIEKASTGLCRAHGWSERSVIGHKEWTNTKIDPRGFSMDTMRGRIASRLDGNPTEENDMQLSDKTPIGEWIMERWPEDDGLQDGSILVSTALASGYGHSRTAADNTRAILAQLGAQAATIDKLVDAIGTGGGLDAAEIRAAAEAGAQAALDRLAVALTSNDG